VRNNAECENIVASECVILVGTNEGGEAMRHLGSIVVRRALTASAMGVMLIAGLPALAQEETAGAEAPVELTKLTSPEELEDWVDGIMAAQLPAHKLEAATVSVVKNGELFFAKGYGLADREKEIPVKADTTLFRPGSISKLFTWTSVMQLYEQGKLDLDADVNTYLTAFKIPDTYPEPITMKNLLTHTPGFEDAGLGLFVRDPSDLVPLRESLATHIPARVRPPGTWSSYSNYGTALAGLIVANLSGVDFETYIDQNIFTPLGMEHSTFREPLPENLAPDMAVGYRKQNGLFEAKGFEYIANFGPAGSLSSTATDMAKFMIAHLQLGRYGDNRILQEDTAKLMHTRLYELDPRLPGMAYGFYESDIRGYHAVGHGGDTGWFHSDLALFPEFDIGIFVSYDAGGGIARMEFIDAFVERYFPDKTKPLPEPPDGSAERARRAAGTYRFTCHNYSSIEKLTVLPSAMKITPGPDGTLVMGTPFGDPWHWREVEPFYYHQIDGDLSLAFHEENGKITHAFVSMLPFMPMYRVAWFATPMFNYVLLVLGILFFLWMLVSAFRHRKAGKEGPPAARTAIRLGVAVSVLTLLFLIGFVAVLASAGESMMAGMPGSMAVVLVIPILSSLLTIGVVIFAVRSWTSGWWTAFRRINYSIFAVLAVGWVWFYYFWNILGWQY